MEAFFVHFCILGCFMLVISLKHVSSGAHERQLINDLFRNYNNLERPVYNDTEALILKFGLTLQQIIDVDEKNQLLTTNVWLNLEWVDVNMKWNKSEYGNIEDIRVPPNKLWKPDVLMYNSADEAFDATYPANVIVSHSGSCTYIPPGIFKSTCRIDITWFPFDDQVCDMKFGSWTYNGFKLDLKLKTSEGDISTYVTNGEWALLGVPGVRNEEFYDCCPEPYLDVTFKIKIRRRTLYYFFNLIVPCVLIASMAVLGFTLPPDSGEKLSLGVTILLSLTVFLNTVSATMPVTSDNPLLGTYFNCIMVMVASSVVTTIIILNFHHRIVDTHSMPDWARVVFLQWLPWMLHMARPGEKLDLKTIKMQNKMKQLDLPEQSSKSLLANVLDMEDDFLRQGGSLPPSPELSMSPDSNHHRGGGHNAGDFRHHHHFHFNSVPHVIDSSPSAKVLMNGNLLDPSSSYFHPPIAASGGGGGAPYNRGKSNGTAATGGPGGHYHHPTSNNNNPSMHPISINNNMTNKMHSSSANHNMLHHPPPQRATIINNNASTMNNNTKTTAVNKELQCILKELQLITTKLKTDQENSNIESDWKFAAMVIDRLCLLSFTVFTIIATIAILFSAPHIIVK